eukprot:scaffold95756_cov43-Attheya_sp.AAC.1
MSLMLRGNAPLQEGTRALIDLSSLSSSHLARGSSQEENSDFLSSKSGYAPYQQQHDQQQTEYGAKPPHHTLEQPLPLKDIATLEETDVLCARGGAALRHAGNQTYRSLVQLKKGMYATCQNVEKLKISRSIVLAIRELNGRFLEKSKTNKLYYDDIGDKKAIDKTCQALREKCKGQPKLCLQLRSSPPPPSPPPPIPPPPSPPPPSPPPPNPSPPSPSPPSPPPPNPSPPNPPPPSPHLAHGKKRKGNAGSPPKSRYAPYQQQHYQGPYSQLVQGYGADHPPKNWQNPNQMQQQHYISSQPRPSPPLLSPPPPSPPPPIPPTGFMRKLVFMLTDNNSEVIEWSNGTF